jgi:hypothetical protein
LTPSTKVLSVGTLQKVVAATRCKAGITVATGNRRVWDQIVVADSKGNELVAIERNTVEPKSLGEAEVQEFLQEIKGEKPACCVTWLNSYLPTIRTIYAFQILRCFDVTHGEKPFYAILDAHREKLKGIIQADREGFSNEDGDQIVWQFKSSASGPWGVALWRNGKWERFQVELSNRKHRAAFLSGKRPKGVEALK